MKSIFRGYVTGFGENSLGKGMTWKFVLCKRRVRHSEPSLRKTM
jgi:hypothetical protein